MRHKYRDVFPKTQNMVDLFGEDNYTGYSLVITTPDSPNVTTRYHYDYLEALTDYDFVVGMFQDLEDAYTIALYDVVKYDGGDTIHNVAEVFPDGYVRLAGQQTYTPVSHLVKP